jgi:hypothetical protein
MSDIGMTNKRLASKIIALKEKDDRCRNKLIETGKLSDGYNPEMEKIHKDNAQQLSQIIDKIGYPTLEKVGKDASAAAWVIIQHSIGTPSFMKKSMKSLEREVQQGKGDPVQLAYLKDRIAVFEGKAQLYGTQFDWDINGKMSPNTLDDINMVDQRRKAIGLNTLEEQIEIVCARVKDENQSPPKDFKNRRKKYDTWRKSVGWI